MTVTQRGELSPEDQETLRCAHLEVQRAEEVSARFRAICVEMIGRSSFRVVSEITGLSTNTLQRWKREAGK